MSVSGRATAVGCAQQSAGRNRLGYFRVGGRVSGTRRARRRTRQGNWSGPRTINMRSTDDSGRVRWITPRSRA